MKLTKILILSVVSCAMPLCATAQQNIKKAFSDFLDNPAVMYSETHSLDSDPTSGVKEAQADVYEFSIPTDKHSLLKNIVKAFRTDADKAYGMNSSTKSNSKQRVILAVGNGDNLGVTISEPTGSDYIYATFLAPSDEDKDGIHRYAYAVNWKRDGQKITGKLVVTYATTLKHRLAKLAERSAHESGKGEANQMHLYAVPDTWFASFMRYVTAMTDASATTRRALATSLYEHVKNVNADNTVTELDRTTARSIIKELIAQANTEHDPVLCKLLNASLETLR